MRAKPRIALTPLTPIALRGPEMASNPHTPDCAASSYAWS
jgi:hypothetical protein